MTGPCPQLASLGLFVCCLSHGGQWGQEEASPSGQALARSLLVSCFVMSCWPKQVSWPNPDSGGRNGWSLGGKCGKSQCKEACILGQEEFVAIFAVCHMDP